MSFVLPGNARSLRFTGEAKAHARSTEEHATITEEQPVALGEPRRRRSPPASARSPSRDLEEYDDGAETRAMNRDALDVFRGGHRLSASRPARASPAPIPHFRAASAVARAIDAGRAAPRLRASGGSGRAPLAYWVLAAIVAGILSYHVTPEILARIEPRSSATRP